jgi:rare lipoprotein A
MTRLTAAHATLPLPSYVKVTNLENGREVVVRVNDRGPFVGTRIIDLSKRSAEALDFKRKGKAKVRVQYIGPAPLDDNGKHLLAMNRELERDTPLPKMIAAASRRKGHTAPAEVQVAAVGAKPRKQLYETATFVPPPAQPAPPAATGIETAFYVQVGSFSDIANAARARDRFASVWPVQFIELSKQGVSVYRVRLGPISGQTDAQTALENAYAAGFPDAHLITAGAMQAALQ